jgi:dTDP-4-amino-4,6-dideoxygalactose transaminase
MRDMFETELAIFGGPPVRRRPWPRWPVADARTEQLMLEVLKSERWAISGPYTGQACYERRFAAAFAAYNGRRYCVPTANGTAALTVALLALGVGPGDEVLVPGLTWVACASAVFCLGAVPVLVDIDPDNLAMALEPAKEAITARTAAILLVHPYCRFADIDGFVALSKQHDIPMIEDCSHAHGACWRGRRAGSFGTIGCFSMQQTKVLTSGEGGAAITDDVALYDRMEQLRSDGRRFTAKPRIGFLELEDCGQVMGQNHCLSEFQAAILYDRLGHVDSENERRAESAGALLQLLQAVEGVYGLPAQEKATCHTYYRFVVRIDQESFCGCSAGIIARALSMELGIHVSQVGEALNHHCLYRPLTSPRAVRSDEERTKLDPSRFSLPVAESVHLRHLTLPHHMLLSGEDGIRDIVLAFEKIRSCSRELAGLDNSSAQTS